MDTEDSIKNFFYKSAKLDRKVTLPLDHIYDNWELKWDEEKNQFREEEDTYAPQINSLILEFGNRGLPIHSDNSDADLSKFLKDTINWPVDDKTGLPSLKYLREEAEVFSFSELELVQSALRVINTCMEKGWKHFDDLQDPFPEILGSILSALLYLRDE